MKYFLLHGIPGCGKSTFTKQVVAEHDNVVVLNRDEVRTELFGEEYHNHKPDSKSEDKVSSLMWHRFDQAVKSGATIVDDNTNLNLKFLRRKIKRVRNAGCEIVQKHFDVPVEECKRRNLGRARHVPESVIDRMAKTAYDDTGHIKRFVISKQTGSVWAVPLNTDASRRLDEFNRTLTPFTDSKGVVLVDVDGTLANNAHFAKYFFNLPKKDFDGFYRTIDLAPVNTKVRDLANRMRRVDGLNLIVLTGRDDSYVDGLINFVSRSGLDASRLICKKTGDYRRDSEFKREAVEGLVSEGFRPVHAFDDRESSVGLMRSLGLQVSVVARPEYEDFSQPPSEGFVPVEPDVDTVYGAGRCLRCGRPISSGNIGRVCLKKIS